MKRIYVAFLSFLLYSQSYGQVQDMLFSQEVVNLFSNYERGIWLSHFAGMNSKAETIVITLGHDRKDYKGILFNVSNNEKSFLEGSFNESDIRLVQMDSTETLMGYLQGLWESQDLSLQYINRKKDKGEILKFSKIERSDFKFSRCPVNMWYASYTGEWEKVEVMLQIQKEEDQTIYGSLSFPTKKQGYVLKGTCKNSSCSQMDGRLIDFNGNTWKNIQLEIRDSSLSVEAKLSAGKNSAHACNLIKQHQQELTCINIQQGQNNLYATFINLGDRNFDKWINEKMLTWQNQYVNLPISEKNENRFQRYMDIEWISEGWVSGILISRSSQKDTIQCETFIYDRKHNKHLEWTDIFIKEFNYAEFFNHWKASHKKEYVKGQSEELADWIRKDPFSLVTLRPEGICFTSEYNPMWGTRKIILPIKEVKTYFRKSSPLKHMN